MAKTKLTDKQQLFVVHYLAKLNGTEAARLAGYAGDDNVLAVTAYDNLRNPKIREAIDEGLRTRILSAEETLVRLVEHATSSMNDFIDIRHGLPFINLEKAAERNKLHLLKKFKNTGKGVEIELYDAQAALVHMGRYHKLFTDKVEVDDWRSQAIADIRAGRVDYVTLAKAFDDTLATQLFAEAGIPVSVGEGAAAERG